MDFRLKMFFIKLFPEKKNKEKFIFWCLVILENIWENYILNPIIYNLGGVTN